MKCQRTSGHRPGDAGARAVRATSSATCVSWRCCRVLLRMPPTTPSTCAAVDLLWELAERDERPSNQHPGHPIRVLRGLIEYKVAK